MDPYEVAARCKLVIENWAGEKIDISEDGIALMSDFARALGSRLKVSVEPAPTTPPDPATGPDGDER